MDIIMEDENLFKTAVQPLCRKYGCGERKIYDARKNWIKKYFGGWQRPDGVDEVVKEIKQCRKR
jgi:hypothetical protein